MVTELTEKLSPNSVGPLGSTEQRASVSAQVHCSRWCRRRLLSDVFPQELVETQNGAKMRVNVKLDIRNWQSNDKRSICLKCLNVYSLSLLKCNYT